jgi:ribosome-associated protein
VLEAGELRLPLAELRFRFSRSSGPGGQHVNRSETRVELLFDVLNSPTLTEHQRTRILSRLAGQIDNEGVLHIFSSTTRSQAENRVDAMRRLQALLAAALKRHKRRIGTRPTAASRERRMAGKRQRAETKQARHASRARLWDDES